MVYVLRAAEVSDHLVCGSILSNDLVDADISEVSY